MTLTARHGLTAVVLAKGARHEKDPVADGRHPDGGLVFRVITSYSIHYTKLYDIAANPAILERVRELLALGHPSRLQADALSILV